MDYQVTPMLDFMENHPKKDLTPYPTKKPSKKLPKKLTKKPAENLMEKLTKKPTKERIIQTDEPTEPPFSTALSLPSMAPSATKKKKETLSPAAPPLTPAPASEEKPSRGEKNKEDHKRTNAPTESGK
jgi:hypothetical protein